MRKELHGAVVSLPGTIIPNGIGVASLVSGVFPEQVRKWINGVTAEEVQWWAVIGILVCLAYWVLRLALRPTMEASIPTRAVSQTHSGVGHNFAADTINWGAQLLQMDEATLGSVVAKLDKSRPVGIASVSYGRTIPMKAALVARLQAEGFQIGPEMSMREGYAPRFPVALSVGLDGLQIGGVTMFPGQQFVALDGDIPVE